MTCGIESILSIQNRFIYWKKWNLKNLQKYLNAPGQAFLAVNSSCLITTDIFHAKVNEHVHVEPDGRQCHHPALHFSYHPPIFVCHPVFHIFHRSLKERKEIFLTYQNNSRHDVIVSYILSTFLPLSHLLKAKFQVLPHFQPLCLVFPSKL